MRTYSASPLDHFWVTIIAVTSVVPCLSSSAHNGLMMFSRSGYVIYVRWVYVFRFKGLFNFYSFVNIMTP